MVGEECSGGVEARRALHRVVAAEYQQRFLDENPEVVARYQREP